VTVRLKQTVTKGARQGVALGVDLRLPTGDERNLLGTGAPGVNPFLAWSGNYGALSPHINAGYQWNGDSILGGEPGSGEAKDLPDLAQYSAGAVIEVHPRITAAVDVLGRYIMAAPRGISRARQPHRLPRHHLHVGVDPRDQRRSGAEDQRVQPAAPGCQPARSAEPGGSARQDLAARWSRVRVLKNVLRSSFFVHQDG
jgi:hypothetical protein